MSCGLNLSRGSNSLNSASGKAGYPSYIILYSRDPVFIMYAVSNFLTSIGFNVPYVYTVVNIFIHSSENMKKRKTKRHSSNSRHAKFTLEINFA